MAMLFALSLSAQSSGGDEIQNGTSGTDADFGVINGNLDDVISLLKKVEAYVFLGVGETRDLKETLGRSNIFDYEVKDLNDNDNVNWFVNNHDIATITDNGLIKGLKFGETVMKVNDEDNNDIYFAVFVCPTITVVSPEGVIYKYHKTYNQKVRLQLTQSQDYLINCVMMNGQDITAFVDKSNGNGDGYFQSTEGVKDNLVFVISEESRHENDGDDIGVVGGSGVNVEVWGHNVNFVATDDKTSLIGKELKIIDSEGNSREDIIGKNALHIANPGIYTVYIEKIPGHFRIIIHDVED